MADAFPAIPTFPALDTMFVGVDRDVGLYEERCRSCGTCMLGDTGGICPVTRCSKGVLNGPCGGTREDGSCELADGIHCAWHDIYDRLKGQGRLAQLLIVRPPMEWVDHGPRYLVQKGYEGATRRRRRRGSDEVREQSGESADGGPFRRHRGARAPDGSDLEFVNAKAELLRGAVDAVNVTDNQTAVVRMSSVSVSAILVRMGIEPVMQMVCRDRNRIAMQSDIFGAAGWASATSPASPATTRPSATRGGEEGIRHRFRPARRHREADA